jgi:hypothetical protein
MTYIVSIYSIIACDLYSCRIILLSFTVNALFIIPNCLLPSDVRPPTLERPPVPFASWVFVLLSLSVQCKMNKLTRERKCEFFVLKINFFWTKFVWETWESIEFKQSGGLKLWQRILAVTVLFGTIVHTLALVTSVYEQIQHKWNAEDVAALWKNLLRSF